MDEEYDAIVLGTGLKECVISGLLSVSGKKVLHMDKQKYYGGESASITPLKALFEHHGKEYIDKEYGKGSDWNVDLIPKLLMARGELVKILIQSGVTRYLEFKSVEGSYVYYKDKISKLPATPAEALKTDLVGILTKRSFGEFFKEVYNCAEDGCLMKKGYRKGMTTAELFKLFNVTGVSEVIGHAIGLQIDDDYLEQPCEDTICRLKLYSESVTQYGKSPYLYPLYGLGELPQGFARLSAIYGGTYMLDKPITEIVMEDGKAVGVTSQGETARTKMVIGDPTYFPNLVKKTGKVVRIICILDHPLLTCKGSALGVSSQLIIPCNSVKDRKSDIYVCCVSFAHHVATKGHYIAIASCKVETDKPEQELEPALRHLRPIKDQFVSVSDMYEPINDGKENNIYISKSYDATTHFETTCQDIKDIYRRVTGAEPDFSRVSVDLEKLGGQ